MTNWNYAIEESNGILVLVNQNTKNKDYKVDWVNREDKRVQACGVVSSVKYIEFPFSRIDNINEELLKEKFPECYI